MYVSYAANPDYSETSGRALHTSSGPWKLTDTGLNRIADDQSRTTSIPLGAERRPGEFLALSKAAIQLTAGLRNLKSSAVRPVGRVEAWEHLHSAGYVMAVQQSVSSGAVRLW